MCRKGRSGIVTITFCLMFGENLGLLLYGDALVM